MKFIKENTHPLQQAVVLYHAPREVNLGDVFYKIEAVDFQYFREPCLVCKGEQKLTVNGHTFKCPCCGDARETLRACGFVVRRFRVYKITDEVGSDEWKASTTHRVRFDLYRKVGHGNQFADRSATSFYEHDLCVRLNPSEKDKIRAGNADGYFFDDYKLAENAAKILIDAEIKKVEEYNTLHGSSYVLRLTTENDKKSNYKTERI
jgi:hypothetical protein